MKKIFLLLNMVFILSSCSYFTRTVYVPHGQAVRLRETVDKVDVWVKTKDGETVAGEMDLPEGWYCLPDEGDE